LSVTEQPELAATILSVLCQRAQLAIEPLVRRAATREEMPDPAYVAVAVEVARCAPGVVDELLGHPDESVRRAAAVVLGEIGDSESMRSLVRKASDPDAAVRKAATVALGRMGETAVRPLTTLLSDRDPEVQRSAAEVLASVKVAASAFSFARWTHRATTSCDAGLSGVWGTQAQSRR